jgi:myo-inositol-1(or 4)-monophosphatase
VAIAAATAGADVVRTEFGGRLTHIAKSSMDFATNADITSEQAIVEILATVRPNDAYLGEELGQSGAVSSDRTWLVDPICGTLNFAARTPSFAVNVALRTPVGVRVAATADPIAAEVYWTDGGATYTRHDGVDTRAIPSALTHLVDVNLDPPYCDPYHPQVARILSDPEFMTSFRPRVLSTTLALAWVAVGRRAAYITAGDLRDSVHFSSGIALCQSAGCIVTGILGQPLHTGVGGLVAAADRDTHKALTAIVARQFPS